MATNNPTFDDLCESQLRRFEGIRKIITNYRKASKQNRTPTYIKNRLEELEKIWEDFEETDEETKEHPDFKADHEYFQESGYDKTEDWYNTARATLTEKLNSPSIKAVSAYKIPPPKTTSQRQITFQRSVKRISESINKETLRISSKAYLHNKIQMLKKHWEPFEETHEELIINMTAEDKENEYFKNGTYDLAETTYSETIITLQEQLEKRFALEESGIDRPHNSQLNDSHPHNSNFSAADAQTLLPKFNGDTKDLHRFISCGDDIYETVVTHHEIL